MTTSASFAASDTRHDAEPGALRLRLRLRARAEADAHVHAGVAQVERVGVALRAVADDRDLPLLEQVEVRVLVVVDRRHLLVPYLRFGGASVLKPRSSAMRPERHSSWMPKRAEPLLQRVELAGGAARLDDERVRRDVHDGRLVGLRERPELGVVPLRRADLHEQQLALDEVGGDELPDLDHRHELLHLPHHLLDRLRAEPDDDGHAGVLRSLGRADGEARDVVAAPREEPGDAVQDAGLVLDEQADGVGRAVGALFRAFHG